MSRGRDDDDDLPREETGWLDDLRSAKKSEDRVPGRKTGGTDRWAKLSALSGGDDEPPAAPDPRDTGGGGRRSRPESPPPRDTGARDPGPRGDSRAADTGGRRRAAEEANSLIGRRARDDGETGRGASGLIGRRAAERDRDRDRDTGGFGRRSAEDSAPAGPRDAGPRESEARRRRGADDAVRPDRTDRAGRSGEEDTGGFGRRSAEDRDARRGLDDRRDTAGGGRRSAEDGVGRRSAEDTGAGRRSRAEAYEPMRADPAPGAPLRRRESEPGGQPPAQSTSPFSPEGRRARSMFAGGVTDREAPISPAPPVDRRGGIMPGLAGPEVSPLSPAPSSRLTGAPPFSPAGPALPPPPVSPPARRGAPATPDVVPPAGVVMAPGPRPAVPGEAGGPRARAGLAAGVEAIRGARSEVRRQLREQQRLRMWTLITLVVAIVGALPFYFVLQAATRDPVVTSLDALAVPSWAAVAKEDIITGSRWCLMDCRLRERKTKSAQPIKETEAAYREALLAAGWIPLTDVPTCEPIEGFAHTCWRRDEFTLDLTVAPPDCEDKLHGRPTIAPTTTPDPSASPSVTASAAPPTGEDCGGSVVSIKVFNAIADERLRFSPEPTVDPNLNDEDLQTATPTPTQ